MGYKTLLLHVEATPESDARLHAAVSLAHDLGAGVIGLGGAEPAYLNNPMLCSADGEAVQLCADLAAEDLRTAGARFQEATKALGLGAVWMSALDYPDHALPTCAAGADLIVASAGRGPRASTAGVADLVMRAGVPVLMLPPNLAVVATGRVMVAWKNTREGRRAVSDALPFLEQAHEVFLVAVRTPGEGVAAAAGLDDATARLRRHGLDPAVHTLSAPPGGATDALIDFARAQRIDLIVAGAFGRPRALEWMLGGITQRLLESSPLPVIFSR